MYRILKILRENEEFVSGEEIGRMLGVSRAMVWKGIQKLRAEGYEINSITNKGYHLRLKDNMYNKTEISRGLETKAMGREVYFFKETDTTNNQLKHFAQEGAAEGTIVVAETMTHGRGRREKGWEAPEGSGIWMSLLLRPNLPPHKVSVLTLLAGLAVSEGIEEETGIQCEIKWPNDILIKGKKCVGILVEMDCEMEQTHFVILGIGINVNTQEFSQELKNSATSLAQETGRIFSRAKILQKILLKIEERYEEFIKKGEGFLPFLAEYEKKCITLDNEIEIHTPQKPAYLARGIGITPEGELKIRHKDTGREEVIFSGEVSVRRGNR